MANNWDQRPEENQQDQNGDNNGAWDNNADNTSNSQHQQTDQGQGDNSQNNDQQWQDSSGGGWGNESAQNNQTEGNWDNNGQNPQPQGNLDSDTVHDPGTAQPQQPAQNWPSQPTPPQASRTTRPLYGPYGAYYSTNLHAGTALSPTAEAEEEPPFDVPEMIAVDRGTTHQVQPGKGYLYVHKRASPEYLDAIEEPYARFVFKYRTKGMFKHIRTCSDARVPMWPRFLAMGTGENWYFQRLMAPTEQIERELGIAIKCEPTGDEEKRKLADKTQDELIELLVRAQVRIHSYFLSLSPFLLSPAKPQISRDKTDPATT